MAYLSTLLWGVDKVHSKSSGFCGLLDLRREGEGCNQFLILLCGWSVDTTKSKSLQSFAGWIVISENIRFGSEFRNKMLISSLHPLQNHLFIYLCNFWCFCDNTLFPLFPHGSLFFDLLIWKQALQPCFVALFFFDLGKWQECVEQSQKLTFPLINKWKGQLTKVSHWLQGPFL